MNGLSKTNPTPGQTINYVVTLNAVHGGGVGPSTAAPDVTTNAPGTAGPTTEGQAGTDSQTTGTGQEGTTAGAVTTADLGTTMNPEVTSTGDSRLERKCINRKNKNNEEKINKNNLI